MKILYIELCNFRDYPLGGHLSFALHITKAMQGNMDLVGIATDPKEIIGKWTYKYIENYQYKIFNIAYIKPKSFKKPIIPARLTDYIYLKKFIDKLELNNYDIIIVQTPEVLLALPNDILNKVCLVTPGVENPLTISRYKIARLFAKVYDKIFFKNASKVKCILAVADKNAISNFIKRSNNTIDVNKVHQFPTRYDANIFNIRDKIASRENLGLPENEIIIVTTGRLNWFKGWKFIIDSFRKFKEDMPSSHLYFIGDGEDHSKIQEYINSCKCKDVTLLGRKDLITVSDYLNAADLFVMGSYKEGWSTSLVEAVACGLPCVVTDFSSAKEMIEEGVNGFVLSKRDETTFKDKMVAALKISHEKLYEKAVENQKYSVQNMRKEIEKIL